jgi:hypothetical protein
MATRIRRLASFTLLVCALTMPASYHRPVSAGSLTSAQLTAVQHPAAVEAPVAASGFLMEVRLRRLHIVRPDLILFPLDYQVIC